MAYEPYIDWYMAAARGLPNVDTVHKFGKQTNLTTASFYPVWSRNTTYTYLAAASYLKIASDGAGGVDGTAGTGVIQVNIEGVNANREKISETVVMKGFVGATTANQYLRIYRMYSNTVGALGYNLGRVTAIPDAAGNTFTAAGVPTTTSNVLCQMDSTTNQTLMTMYTVALSNGSGSPINAYMTGYQISTFVGKNVNVELYVREYGQSAFRIKKSWALNDATAIQNLVPPEKIPGGADIEFRAKSSSTAGQLSVDYDLVLVTGD